MKCQFCECDLDLENFRIEDDCGDIVVIYLCSICDKEGTKCLEEEDFEKK